jgi:hypothetical protein
MGEQVAAFFRKGLPDLRLRPQHISLYLAILWMSRGGPFSNRISITRGELMKIAKISSKATYHKCMRDLQSFGYIQYIPSYNSFEGSKIFLLLAGDTHQVSLPVYSAGNVSE